MMTLTAPVPDFSLDLALSLVTASVAPVLLLDGDLEVVAASQSFSSSSTLTRTPFRDAAFRIWGTGNGTCPSSVHF